MVEVPSQTEVVIRGSDRHLVGYFASQVRSILPPEPYKGKGIRYSVTDSEAGAFYSAEQVIIKETKKK